MFINRPWLPTLRLLAAAGGAAAVSTSAGAERHDPRSERCATMEPASRARSLSEAAKDMPLEGLGVRDQLRATQPLSRSGGGTTSRGGPDGSICALDQTTACQTRSFAIAYNSTTYHTAESINVMAPIFSLCWYGVYFGSTPVPDGFVVTFFTSENGMPGAELDRFTQGVDLSIAGPAATGQVFLGREEYVHAASLTRPVLGVAPGACVFIDVHNDAQGDTWFWMDGDGSNGNLQSAQDTNLNGIFETPAEVLPHDLAICVNGGLGVPQACFVDPCLGLIPGNDACELAAPLTVGQSQQGTSRCAAPDEAPSCSGAELAGVWYSFTGTGGTMTIDTCATAFYDTRLEVYCDDCAHPVCVGSNDDSCGAQSSVSVCTRPGTTYLALVHGFAGEQGTFDVTLTDSGAPCSGASDCNPCLAVAVPPGAASEQEPCGSDTNGGCNSFPTSFEQVACSTVIHGTAFAEFGARDTDWFRFVAPESGEAGVTVTTVFPALVLLMNIPDGDCNAMVPLGFARTTPCAPVSVSASGLTPGAEYYAFIGPSTYDGVACGGDYTAAFSVGGACAPACPCDVNGDSALNSQDFFDFIACFFTPQCAAADFSRDGAVNSQDFFDFLSCFFSPPAGCP